MVTSRGLVISSVAVLALFLAFTACSSSPSGAGGSGDTLNVALASLGGQNMDPMQESLVGPYTVGGPMYDFLVTLNTEGQIAPGLAEKWEKSADGLQYTFHLRKGIKWHDNQGEVTANDAKYSIERAIKPTSKAFGASSLQDAVKDIQVPDPSTLVITLKKAAPYFLYFLSPPASVVAVLPKDYVAKVGEDVFQSKPVGSGPWKFVRSVPGLQVDYDAVDKHWRGTPAFKHLTLMQVPEQGARVAMLKTGQSDIVDISGDQMADVSATGNRVWKVAGSQGLDLVFWGYSLPAAAKMPTADLRIRKALSLAINREEIIQYVAGGAASFPLPTRVFYSAGDVDPKEWESYSRDTYRYSPDEAKKLIGEAGLDKGFTIKLFKFAQPGIPWQPKAVDAIASYWGKVGVTAQVTEMDYGTFQPTAWPNTKPEVVGQASSLRISALPDTPSGLKSLFHSKGSLHEMSDPAVDRMIDQAAQELDDAKRKGLLSQAIKTIADSYVSVPIAAPDLVVGVGNKVGEWKPMGGAGFVGLWLETVTRKAK